MNDMRVEIICQGELVNQHSDSTHYGWGNPLDVVPPIGSIIEYMTFNQNRIQGVLSKYLVKGYTFTTEEDFNSSFTNKVCKIFVDKIE